MRQPMPNALVSLSGLSVFYFNFNKQMLETRILETRIRILETRILETRS